MTVVPSAETACGHCTLCCKVMAIEEFAKPVNSLGPALRTVPE